MLTTRYVTGAPNWVDVGTPDIEGAKSFYGGLFGWEFQAGGPEVGGYGMFRLAGRIAAGGMQVPTDQGQPAWTVYFQTPDADSTGKAAEQAGGTVLMQPMDVLDQGRMAMLGDQAGVPFGVWQPGANTGLEVAGVPGSLCWIELYTPDVATAADFYASVFGMETSEVSFPGGMYTCVNPAEGGPDAMFGGMVPLAGDPSEAEAGAYWLPYFEVTDTDATVAKAEQLGGKVRMAPTDLPEVGRMAKLADPYGARFAVIKSAQPGS
ncbi:VOC family protein [Streptomyces cavernae]|uniref:VOC family protein n=1 Tax=Streptomyces cavernae TaxID=2259034 RepID=UPI000FEC0DC8|nr:VOC family protein [Streptomyces cavernae]